MEEKRHMLLRLASVLSVLLGVHTVAAQTTPPVPDLSGMWGRNVFGFGEPSSGPGPVTNLKRLPDGTSDPENPAGDYRNPILKA
jgi:hypothetical protein